MRNFATVITSNTKETTKWVIFCVSSKITNKIKE